MRQAKNHGHLGVITTDGDHYEAIREKRDGPWLISHPYGDERMYGTVPQIRIRLCELITKHNEEKATP